MPQSATITLTDRSSITHTFNPSGEKNDVHTFIARDTNGVPIGDSTLTVSRRDTGQNIAVRLVLRVPVIVTETINGVDNPKVARTSTADIKFTFSKYSTSSEREVLVGLAADALGASQTVLDAVLTDLEDLF